MLRSSDLIYRASSITLTIFFTLYIGLVILPFFNYGLHLQPADLVAGGSFDPKDLALYDYRTGTGSLIRFLSVVVAATLPVWMLGCGGLLTITVAYNWRSLTLRQRRLAMVVLLVGACLVLFNFSPLGHLILIWFFD